MLELSSIVFSKSHDFSKLVETFSQRLKKISENEKKKIIK